MRVFLCVCVSLSITLCASGLLGARRRAPQDHDLGPAIWTLSNTSTPSVVAGVLHFDQIMLGDLSELCLSFVINLFIKHGCIEQI